MMDVYDLWVDHDAKQEAWRMRQPKCCHCGEHILDDDLFDINGNLYHEDCAEAEFKKKTEDYEE